MWERVGLGPAEHLLMCISDGDAIAAMNLPSGDGMARVKAIPLQLADGVRQTISRHFTRS